MTVTREIWDILFNLISNQNFAAMTARLSSEDHSLTIWLPIKLHIFIFTNRGEVNSPRWVIQIVAAPVPLHSLLYCFPQAKVSEYIWFACLRCRIYVPESPEGQWLHPGSVDRGIAVLGACTPLFLLWSEDGPRWWLSTRGESGRGTFSLVTCDSPYLRHVFSHDKGLDLWSGLHPEICAS